MIDRANSIIGTVSKLLRSAMKPAIPGNMPIPMPAAANMNPIALAPCRGPNCCCKFVTINAQMGASVKP